MSGEARCAHVARRTVNGACWRGQCSDGRCRFPCGRCHVTGSGGCCVLARAPLEGMRIEEIGSRSEIFAQSHVMV